MNAKFICAGEDYCSFETHVAAPYLRKSFHLDFAPKTATLSIAGLGFYKLYINGVDVTKGLLAPYVSNPDHYVYVDTYDVAEHLRMGDNAIGILLGNGMMNAFGAFIWDFDKEPWRGAPRCALELTCIDGENTVTLTTDESFKTHPSPITFDDLRIGEYYDATREIDGWNLPDFDDAAWANAVIAPPPKGEWRLGEADSIVVIAERTPVRVSRTKNGYLYDFGVNTAGLCRLQLSNARRDQTLVLRYGECVDEAGELDRSSTIFNRENSKPFCNNNQIDRYVAKGEPREIYLPSFTYHGFRYVEVLGLEEGQATDDLLTLVEYTSASKTTGDFICSDATVNTLFEMVERSDRSNFYYFPTDCPHREKNGWTGDAVLSAERMVLLYGVENSLKEWLHNIRKSQTEQGDIAAVVPTGGWGYGIGPAWDKVLFELPHVLYKYRGDTAVVRENADAMVRYLQFLESHERIDGLLSFGLKDWCPVGKNCDEADTPLEVSTEITVMDIARKAADLLAVIGDSRAAYAEEFYRRERALIREKLVDFDRMELRGAAQSGQAMAIHFGVFEKDEEQAAFARLMALIEEQNGNFTCGAFGMNVLFHVLSRFGEGELAYRMITKKEYPSYAFLIERGDTSMVELIRQDRSEYDSHNHHFFGGIALWFVNRIAGLEVVDSQRVVIHPDFIAAISHAAATCTLPDGKVRVSWERTGEDISLAVSVPDGVEYTVQLPADYEWDGVIAKKKYR